MSSSLEELQVEYYALLVECREISDSAPVVHEWSKDWDKAFARLKAVQARIEELRFGNMVGK